MSEEVFSVSKKRKQILHSTCFTFSIKEIITIWQNQTIAYYNQNAASFIQGTVSVDFQMTQDKLFKRFAGKESAGFRVWFRKRHEVFSGKRSCCYGDGRFRRTVQIRQCLYRYSGKNMIFQDLDEMNQYDGIWACSSILHLP